MKSSWKRLLVPVAILATAATLLSGCSSGASSPSNDNAKSFNWKNYSGTTINALMVQHPMTDAIKQHLKEFEKLTGIKVNVEELDETDYMTKLTTELQSKAGDDDVFMTSQPMNYQYAAAGWIQDLQPFIDNPKLTEPSWDEKDFFPATISANRWDKTEFGGAGKGGLWAIPANEEGYALFYRKDILANAGMKPPTTIDELVADANKLNGTAFDGKTISGFVSRGDKTYPTLNPFSTFFMSYGAKDITDKKATMNSPTAIAATQKWVDIMQDAPKAASTFTWYEAEQYFLAGNSAFYIDADHMAADFEKDGSAIKGKVGYSLPPAGPKGPASSMWVWSLGMNAASKHQGAAWQLIQWATSKTTMTQALANGNINPVRQSVAQSPEMTKLTADWGDYNQVWQKILADYAHWPYTPAAQWTQVGDLWTTAIQSAVLKQQTVKQALDGVAKQVDQMISNQ